MGRSTGLDPNIPFDVIFLCKMITLLYFHFYNIFDIYRFYQKVTCLYSILQAELIDPAVKGTLNVLRSCAKVPSIKRVVITSSMAAVAGSKRPLNPDVVIDETWFSDPEYCEESKVCSDICSCPFNNFFFYSIFFN